VVWWRGMYALRGAVPVEADDQEAIEAATARLMRELMARNGLRPTDIVSVVLTSTPDLTRGFPAAGARRAGLDDVPMLGATEVGVPGAAERIVRVLVHVDGAAPRGREHVYLDRAAALRPDRARAGASP
jgi:chorismate mutase